MNIQVSKALIVISALAASVVLVYQNCAPVKVSDLSSESSVVKPQGEPPVISKDCNTATESRKDGDTWWIPNGQTRDLVQCTVGTGNQFKVFDEEVEVTCASGEVKLTGEKRRNSNGQLEGICNLDCGDRKNNEKWWIDSGVEKKPVQCSVGTGTQLSVYTKQAEYQCLNAQISLTGNTREVPTNKLEGECNLNCGEHTNGSKWWVEAGKRTQSVQCTVGTGTQTQEYKDENEYTCINASAQPTGNSRSTPIGGLMGTCNLDCGERKNNELWWIRLEDSKETKKCATSLTATQEITYKNEAEYKCSNAVEAATGNTKKTVLSETSCPALSFNDTDHQATLAYEDVYPDPDDSDYNDFVANIKVLETYNSLEQLTKIEVTYTPKVKLAGFWAQFVLVFDGQVRGRNGFVSNVAGYKSEPMFQGSANIKMETFNSSGNRISIRENISKNQDLIVFEDTTVAVQNKPTAKITIQILDPALNTLSERKGLSIKRYRSVLYVKNVYGPQATYYDIDLSDINPTMFDKRLMPLAFFVPVNWKAPASGVDIIEPYPLFKKHAEYLYSGQPISQEPAEFKEWFNNLVAPSKVLN